MTNSLNTAEMENRDAMIAAELTRAWGEKNEAKRERNAALVQVAAYKAAMVYFKGATTTQEIDWFVSGFTDAKQGKGSPLFSDSELGYRESMTYHAGRAAANRG